MYHNIAYIKYIWMDQMYLWQLSNVHEGLAQISPHSVFKAAKTEDNTNKSNYVNSIHSLLSV